MRLLQLAFAALAFALIAGAPAASAAAPKPDPAPVQRKPPPPPPPASHPAATPTPPPSTTKAKTTSPKQGEHKQVNGSAGLRPVTHVKARTVLVPAGSTALRSTSSNTLKVAALSLAGLGVLLLVLAMLEPIYVRPRSLIATFAEHRGDVAIAGALILLSVGIAYLSTAL